MEEDGHGEHCMDGCSMSPGSWKWLALIAIAVAIYALATRKKIIGTVDASGTGMTVNGK
jgi:hypothetical protein